MLFWVQIAPQDAGHSRHARLPVPIAGVLRLRAGEQSARERKVRWTNRGGELQAVDRRLRFTSRGEAVRCVPRREARYLVQDAIDNMRFLTCMLQSITQRTVEKQGECVTVQFSSKVGRIHSRPWQYQSISGCRIIPHRAGVRTDYILTLQSREKKHFYLSSSPKHGGAFFVSL